MEPTRKLHSITTSLLLFGGLLASCQGFKTVVVIHGLRQSASSLKDIDGYIREAHPGTDVQVLDLYTRLESVDAPMMEQVRDFGAAIKKISDAHPEGFHLIGFSQGGLIARGVLQVLFWLFFVHVYISIILYSEVVDSDLCYQCRWYPT